MQSEKGGFDRIAKYYDQLAWIVFGRSLAKAQVHFFNRIPDQSKILVLGGGTGRWLMEILNQKPACSICYVEKSKSMLELAKRATGKDHRIEFRLGTENSITERDHFDVVITACFLDLFSDDKLNLVIDQLKVAMKSNSLWLVTDFVSTRWWHLVMLSVMYIFFRIMTGLRTDKLPDWGTALREHQVMEVSQEFFYNGFIKSSLLRIEK